jgi:hypothetical protein
MMGWIANINNAFAINEQFDKILLEIIGSSLHLKWESIPPATNWVCSWFCIGPHIL